MGTARAAQAAWPDAEPVVGNLVGRMAGRTGQSHPIRFRDRPDSGLGAAQLQRLQAPPFRHGAIQWQNTAMVRLEGVGLQYRPAAGGMPGPAVLSGLSFDVPEGGFRWLLGPSGAGKTRLLRLLHLAVRPTDGRLTILGTEVDHAARHVLPALRRRIGMVFQDFRLLPHLVAYDNVALPLRLGGRPEGQIRADVTEMLRWVGLQKKANALPAELSGGEQQRVAIARAVVGRPNLLLADEPTGNLDDIQAERLMVLLHELNRVGTTVIVATHNDALVARHPGDALRLDNGRLRAGG